MSETPLRSHRKVRVLTFVASTVSVLVSAAWWILLVGPVTELFPTFEYYYVEAIEVMVLAAAVAIGLNIAGGSRGGIDRRICVVAGLVLFSPLLCVPFAAF